MCDCIQKINTKLKPHNLELDTVYSFDPAGFGDLLALRTKSLKVGRLSPKKLFGAYCPFCGEKFQLKSIVKEAA